MKKHVKKFVLGLLIAGASTTALANSWPSNPIRMVVPYPPGGATDFSARAYADELRKVLKQTIIVENKAGAAGEIGAQFVAAAKADGYTILLGALGSLAINSLLPSKKQQYEFPSAFEGVSMATSTPLAIVVRSDLPAKNVQELIALAKDRKGELSYGSAGYGASQHRVGEKFQQATETELLHVPYQGSGPALSDLIGGQVDLIFDTMPTLMGHVKNPKLRFIGITTSERSSSLPEVPTLQEQGVKDFDISTRYVLLAPKGTPKDILDRLSDAMKQAAQVSSVQSAMSTQGADAVPSSPSETNQALQEEVAIWTEVVKNANLK